MKTQTTVAIVIGLIISLALPVVASGRFDSPISPLPQPLPATSPISPLPVPMPASSPLYSPLPIPSPASMPYSFYLPIVSNGSRLFGTDYSQYPGGCVGCTACDYNDPYRGQFYRNLITTTAQMMGPLLAWSDASCYCGLSTAQIAGAAFGLIIGRVFRIVRVILGVIWNAVQSALGILLDVLALFYGDATASEVVCEDDAVGICIGMAAVFAMDDVAGGIITLVVLLLLGVLSFYLALFIISQVREMLQPSGSDE